MSTRLRTACATASPVANGTDAIYIVLRMLGIGPGDEVITTAASWISTSETIGQAGGATGVRGHGRVRTTSMSERSRRSITPRTRAIIPVHLYGQAAQVEVLEQLAGASAACS